MLQRMKTYDKILTVHGEYNTVLEELLSDRRHHYVIDPNPILWDVSYFTKDNNLNAEGAILFWKEIDECIRLYEARDLALRPRKDTVNEPRTDSAAMLRFRMPPPPPLTPRHSSHSSVHHARNDLDQNRHHDRQTSSGNRTNNNSRRPDHVWVNRKFLPDY